LSQQQPFQIYAEPELEDSCLVVGWSEDVGRMGEGVIECLNRKLGGREFAELDLEAFFQLGGVAVQDNIARFPEVKFSCCPGKNVVTLKSSSPRSEWYRFMESVLDIARDYCHVKEIFSIGGMVYLGPHTTPRQLMAISNSAEMRDSLNEYDLIRDLDYETPPGQRPTLSSFLIWSAARRDIAAASLWIPVPFYLVGVEDPRAWQRGLDFLDERLGLEMDLSDIAEAAMRQNERIARLRVDSPEVDDYIHRLETGTVLSQDESESLFQQVNELLKQRE